ncbi:hypothetical protein niasHS_007775 [Heterodera schachtii]|uniref:Uncharacterized protein n=1 Tax=Heterodera schachtii TaxID=97005 RepID=A0ABD2JPL9_HETSC
MIIGVFKVFIYLLLLNHCSAFKDLKCKFGNYSFETGKKEVENVETKECEFEQYYCRTTICISDDQPTNKHIRWDCYFNNKAKVCAELAEQSLTEQNYKNFKCKCEYGNFNEEMGNEQQKNLKCLRGEYDHNGYGGLQKSECEKEHQFCFLANCKTDTKSIMRWGCIEKKDCAKLATIWTLNQGKNNTCDCQFGGRLEDMGNEKLNIAMWMPPVNIEFTEIEINGGGPAAAILGTFRLAVGPFRFCLPTMIGIVGTFNVFFLRLINMGGFA